MSTLDQVGNFIRVVVSIGYGASDTLIILATGQGALLPNPSSGNYNMVWWNATDYTDPSDDPNVEIVRVTAISTDTLTVTRAQEGTNATIKNNSGKTYKMLLGITAKMITDIQAALNSAGASTAVRNEVVSGSGTSWTLAHTPLTGQLTLYGSGIRLTPTVDYTLSGTTITMVNGNTYKTGLVLADYNY